MTTKNIPPLRLAVLISGGGTTLRNLLTHIDERELPASIELVVSSNPSSIGLQLAAERNIPTATITTKELPVVATFSAKIFDACRAARVDYVVCAGFLKRLTIPDDFEFRVLNIHPSMIPEFCGEGMYGRRVHEAVLAAGVEMTGCTVHFVDDEYDHGPIIAQREVSVLAGDTPESLAARVFQAECELYPQVIRKLAKDRGKNNSIHD